MYLSEGAYMVAFVHFSAEIMIDFKHVLANTNIGRWGRSMNKHEYEIPAIHKKIR